MEAGPKASRRTVLRHGVLALGAIAGAVGLAGTVDKVRSGTLLVADAPGTTRITLVGSDWHLSAPGLRRGDLPKRGDHVSVTGVVAMAGRADEAGSFFASVQHLDNPAGHGSHALAQLETHTFQLAGGTLFGIGTTIRDQESSYAIIGGTGKYLGASGSYIGKQNPLETGGDGTAHFTLTLNSGR